MKIDNKGSRQQYANVVIEGVPVTGVIDSGAEITIINGKLFARIAVVAQPKKSQLKPQDKIPKTYDRRMFTLDGRIDGTVERFNQTLKTMLRKHAARFRCQWDRFLPGVLWAYRNTPHTSTGEKPLFLLFDVDCRTPTEAAYLPMTDVSAMDVTDYREELMLSLSSARQLAVKYIQKAQARYKKSYASTTALTTTTTVEREEAKGEDMDTSASNNPGTP